MSSRGEGLDKLEILASLGAILSNIPELTRFVGQARSGEDKEEKGKWIVKLIETLSFKDEAMLEQNTTTLKEPNKSLIRDLVSRMGQLDKNSGSGYITSFAAHLYVMENEVDERTEVPPAASAGQQKGGKAKGPAAPTVTKKISRANTAESAQIIYLNGLAEDIRSLMDEPRKMARDQAINKTIEDLELRGVISSDSLKKRFEAIRVQLKELNPELVCTIVESIAVIGKDDYDRIVKKIWEVTKDAKSDPVEQKGFYEERVACCLEAAMDVKVNLRKPQGVWRKPLREYVDSMRNKSENDPKIRRTIAIAIVNSIAGPQSEISPSEELLRTYGIRITPMKIASERLPWKWMLIAAAVLGLFVWLMGGLPTIPN